MMACIVRVHAQPFTFFDDSGKLVAIEAFDLIHDCASWDAVEFVAEQLDPGRVVGKGNVWVAGSVNSGENLEESLRVGDVQTTTRCTTSTVIQCFVDREIVAIERHFFEFITVSCKILDKNLVKFAGASKQSFDAVDG